MTGVDESIPSSRLSVHSRLVSVLQYSQVIAGGEYFSAARTEIYRRKQRERSRLRSRGPIRPRIFPRMARMVADGFLPEGAEGAESY